MSQRAAEAVVVGDYVRPWGSATPFLKVVGLRRAAGLTRLWLLGASTPLEVSAGAVVDAQAQP